MGKFFKRTLAIMLVFVMTVGVAPLTGFLGLKFPNLFAWNNIVADAASFDDINDSSVFLKQEGSRTCTLCAATMMMRRYSMLRGDEKWNTITESKVRNVAWTSEGLYLTFSYSDSANGISKISVKCESLPKGSANKQILIDLLKEHPEGLNIWYSGAPHAVLLTDYTNGKFYCADPYSGVSSGRIPISEAYAVTISNVSQYWYISSPKVTIQNTLKVYYNANGGSISSDTYKLSSNILYNKDDSTKYCQKWTYNNTKENGLINWETFGIYKKGYTFAGWGTKASGGTVFSDNDASIKPSDLSSNIKNGSCSITLYAQWKPNTLKVYYNANGASITSDTYKISSNIVCNKSDSSKFIQSWTYNNKKENGLTNHSTFGLYKSGYTFAGWGTKASGGTVYSQGDNTLVPTTLNSKIKDGDCSLTLYAQWVPNTLKVYYNTNGASITSDTYKISSNLIYTKSDSAKFYQKWSYNNTKENGLYNASAFGIYKTGYHFAGWGTKATGGTVFDQSDTTVTPLKLSSDIKNGSQSVTLYAQWVPNTVRVYYNANGGSVSSDTYKLVSSNICYSDDGTKIYHDWTYNNPTKNGFTNASTIGLYRTGYTFAGWSTKASGGTVFDQNDTSIVPTDFTSTIKNKNCSVTMYAQWIPNKVTMHFQSAGELLCQTHNVTNNGKLVTEHAIERINETQLKNNGKTYGVTGTKTATLTYGIDSNRISISDAGLTLDEHIGRGYIAYRDYDGTWRAYINDTIGWYTVDEINEAISNGTFNGYNIYAQTGTLKTTSPKGNLYFYAVWVNNHTHSYKLTDTQKATCTEKEIKSYTCSCGDSYQTTQKSLGHDYVAIVTAPTCTDSGYTTHTCSRCLDSYVDTETEELGHSYVKNIVKQSTCTQEGKVEYKCDCGDVYNEALPTTEHQYVKTVFEPTCTSNGYTHTVCSVCAESTIGEYVNPKGHNIQSETIAPTCTEEGYTMEVCSDCTYSKRINVVAEISHKYGEWTTVSEPTETNEGYKICECQVCGETKYDIIPMLTPETYKLIYNANGGTCAPVSKEFVAGKEFEISDVEPLRDGYTFVGWSKSSTATTASYFCGDIISFTEDTVLYAVWKVKVSKYLYNITILTPSTTTISYGDRIVLHAVTEVFLDMDIPDGWYIDWTVSNDNFTRSVSDDGTELIISPNKSGSTTITVMLCDKTGNVISSDEQVMTSKAGFFDKLIGFFKKLFGLTKTIPQAFKVIF